MVRVGSLFSQLLREVPHGEFVAAVQKHRAERYAKGFSCWTQLVAMLFAQLAHADSLREICNGLSCCLGKLVHLGIGRAPRRSTLSYANQHRPAALFEDVFWKTADRFRRRGLLASKKPFRFKNRLLSLDSTTISLCLSLFPWARYRTLKGGVKLHVLLSHDDYLPEYVLITEGRHADLPVARVLSLPAGSIIVMDRAYIDYRLLADWSRKGILWVTRTKENLELLPVEKRKAPLTRNILADEIVIRTVEIAATEKFPVPLRRVTVWDERNQKAVALLTNILSLGPSTIARIYRERWQIELFFKTLKQNLKIKTFVGTTENALRVQIWTALIALLILKWLHFLSRARWSLSNLASMLRLNLFTYRDLVAWLNDPGGTPPLIPDALQLALPLTPLGQLSS
jgi:uncharacterized protein DUF4372/DDE family transposase